MSASLALACPIDFHLRGGGVDVSESLVTATVTFGKTDTGFGLAVDIVAEIPGVDPEVVAGLVEQAHQFCPYSKATRGNVPVTVKGVGA